MTWNPLSWVRAVLYWWRTTNCPFLCGGRLPKFGYHTQTQDNWGKNVPADDHCLGCNRKVKWVVVDYVGWRWVRGEPLSANPTTTKAQ